MPALICSPFPESILVRESPLLISASLLKVMAASEHLYAIMFLTTLHATGLPTAYKPTPEIEWAMLLVKT